MRLLPLKAEAASSWAGLRVLVGELGPARAGAAACRTVPVTFGRDFFASLGPPRDDREAASRRQIAGAVVIYRYLRGALGTERALEVMSRVVRAATVVFLRHTVGPVDVASYRGLDPSGRRAFAERIVERFFNAEARIEEVSAERFAVTVTRCSFPELCRAAGVEELAPLFCEGDFDYFNTPESRVVLTRQGTLAQGHDRCPFAFTLRES